MAWFELHEQFAGHPKVLKLARLLSIPKVQARGHIVTFWCWTTSYNQSGDYSEFSNGDIADASDWEGDPDVFVNALVEAKLIDKDRRVHDWEEHGVRLLTNMRNRQKKHRDGDNSEMSRDNDVTVTHSSRPTDPTDPTDHTDLTDPPTAPPRPGLGVVVDRGRGIVHSESDQPARPAEPGEDLEGIVYDRIGWHRRLSRLDWGRLLALKKQYPDKFYGALDSLNDSVKLVPAYLESVITGKKSGPDFEKANFLRAEAEKEAKRRSHAQG